MGSLCHMWLIPFSTGIQLACVFIPEQLQYKMPGFEKENHSLRTFAPP